VSLFFCRCTSQSKNSSLRQLVSQTNPQRKHGAPRPHRRARGRRQLGLERATALPEFWALVAENGDGLVDASRLMGVCTASRTGVRGFLSTLPGLVVCGGFSQGGRVRDVWRLDLATLRWEPMPGLMTARSSHACCAVRGALVVLGGRTSGEGTPISLEVKMLSSGAFVDLPPLSREGIFGAAAIEVVESDSAAGQVFLLGGEDANNSILSTVHLVDLATGVCARQPDLLHSRAYPVAARMPDGRIICAGGYGGDYHDLALAEVWGAPEQGGVDAAWTWTEQPAMSVARWGCCGCVMSDSRFAVLGGEGIAGSSSSCEALVIGAGAHWESLATMHDSRCLFACAAVAGCFIVAGGVGRKSAEVYDESRNRWLRLPCDLPYWLHSMGSALL
jgi:hypothetical protein